MDKEFPMSFEALRNNVFRFACRMLHNDEDARDITQDMSEKIWNMHQEARISGKIEALAMTMTTSQLKPPYGLYLASNGMF